MASSGAGVTGDRQEHLTPGWVGILPGARPSDVEVLATVGIDLEAVRDRLIETFGA
jgi:hypothetical protein